jgi:2-C-methyl-D-erythritol 4-phosphate cytidylyltransferase
VSAAALVLGAGQGARLGVGTPKALLHVAGKSLLEWSARALARARGVDWVICVVPPAAGRELEALRRDWAGPAALLGPVVGGQTRQASVANAMDALAELAPAARFVLVHDAARCLVEPADAESVLEAARVFGAAIPVVPVSETVKELAGDAVLRTLERERLALAQTPQGFRRELLAEALEKARRDGFQGTDCASLVERAGAPVHALPGRAGNWKVTRPEDLARAQAELLARGAGA